MTGLVRLFLICLIFHWNREVPKGSIPEVKATDVEATAVEATDVDATDEEQDILPP